MRKSYNYVVQTNFNYFSVLRNCLDQDSRSSRSGLRFLSWNRIQSNTDPNTGFNVPGTGTGINVKSALNYLFLTKKTSQYFTYIIDIKVCSHFLFTKCVQKFDHITTYNDPSI